MSSRKADFRGCGFLPLCPGRGGVGLDSQEQEVSGECLQWEIHPKHRASPFTVAELGVLHERLEFSAEAWDRVFWRAALLCTYARARWSDLMHAEQIIYDYDTAQN